MADDPYAVLLTTLETAMREAHRLGLVRTAHRLHRALNTARTEQLEVSHAGEGSVTWRIGPIREQST